MRRLQRELGEFSKALPYDIELEEGSIFQWTIAIHGPDTTPYFGGTFLVRISFPTDYPLTSPSIKIITKIFHPNVNPEGKICLDILGSGWKINTTPIKIIEGLMDLIQNPDLANPIYPEIAKLKLTDEEQFNKIATEWTIKYAM